MIGFTNTLSFPSVTGVESLKWSWHNFYMMDSYCSLLVLQMADKLLFVARAAKYTKKRLPSKHPDL